MTPAGPPDPVDRGAAAGGEAPAISAVAILTADRPALLERALTSYLDHLRRHRRAVELVVFDDSRDPAAGRTSREITRRLGRAFGVPAGFCGRAERRAFVTRLAERGGLPAETLAHALLPEGGYTLGANRNALLLDSVDRLAFGADDDTVCRLASPPTPGGPLEVSVGADPADFWFFASFEEACRAAAPVDHDLLGAHERLLGRPVSELLPAGAEPSGQGGAPGLVAVTVNGLLGDCAWGPPFGLWHVPMGYLACRGPSLDRLTRSDERYREAVRSRQVLRVTASPVLADASFSMLTTWGLDNRQLLPPNVPVNRGQDLVFGQVLAACLPAAVFGHVPLALVHDPLPPRRFWDGEMPRSAAGVDLCRVLVEAVLLGALPPALDSPADRLGALGRHLGRLAALAGLGELLRDRLRSVNRRFERELVERAARGPRATSQYAQDVARFFERLRSSEARPDYWIPLDLRAGTDLAGAEARTRDVLRRFGDLLVHWPTIVETTRALRDEGVRPSLPA